jgi:hypothetical protein
MWTRFPTSIVVSTSALRAPVSTVTIFGSTPPSTFTELPETVIGALTGADTAGCVGVSAEATALPIAHNPPAHSAVCKARLTMMFIGGPS